MGGCCCSTRKSHVNGTPVYFYCPLSLEERESSEGRSGTASMLNAGYGLDLDSSIPNTYRAPPPPLPYDVVFRCPQPKDFNSIKETICGCSFKTPSALKIVGELDSKSQDCPLLGCPPWKLERSKSKGNTSPLVTEEADVCPICLEEYDSEQPEIITKCNHHFHLSCLLEWTERSDACPICDEEMIFELP